MNRMHFAAGLLLLGVCTAAPVALAHHAFSTEFDGDLVGEVTGTVTRVWWANPHIRYDVEMRMPDGSTEQWSLHPPGNLPTYRRIGWLRDSIQVGDAVTAVGNLGRDGAKKLYSTCITLDDGKRFGECVDAFSTEQVTADPDIDYTYQANDYDVDISGFWSNRYKFRRTVDDFDPKPMPMTAAARQIYTNRQFGEDHVLRCLPAGLPRIFGSPYELEIVDAGTHYIFIFMQDNTPRRVYMDGRTAPADFPLTSMGYAVGHWEDRTLVVETTHLLPGWLDGSGYPMSGGNGTRIVERWNVAGNGLTIDRTMTIYDDFYTEPLVRTRGSERIPAGNIVESEACDATPFYAEIIERGDIDELFQ